MDRLQNVKWKKLVRVLRINKTPDVSMLYEDFMEQDFGTVFCVVQEVPVIEIKEELSELCFVEAYRRWGCRESLRKTIQTLVDVTLEELRDEVAFTEVNLITSMDGVLVGSRSVLQDYKDDVCSVVVKRVLKPFADF